MKRIAALSAANPDMVFTHVIHHINEESLRTCFHELDGKKAIGIDGVDKANYGENLDENLRVECAQGGGRYDRRVDILSVL